MSFDPTATLAPEKGAVLLPTQARFVVDPEPFKLLEKGRRTGGTWGIAYAAAERIATRKGEGGKNVYYIPQTYEDAVEFIETAGNWLRALDVAAGAIEQGTVADEVDLIGDSPIFADQDPDRAIQTYVIRVPTTGFRVVALSSSPARIRGKQGLIIFDEAAFHAKFAAVLKSAMALLLRGGEVWVLSTHNGEDSAFNDAVQAVRHGERRGKVYSYPFRQAVAEGMYQRICEMRGEPWTQAKEDQWVQAAYDYYGDDAAEELDAIPASGEGAYFSAAQLDRAMHDAPVIRWSFSDAFGLQHPPTREREVARMLADEIAPLIERLDASDEHVYGLDYARVGHLTVIAPAAIDMVLRRTIPFGIELRNCPVAQQKQICKYLARGLPHFVAGVHDATGSGAPVAEDLVDDLGAVIEPVMLNDAVYAADMEHLKESLDDDLIRIPRDKDWRRDLRQVHKIRGIPKVGGTERKGVDGGLRHGDAAVALMLMERAARRDPVEIDFTAPCPPSHRDAWRQRPDHSDDDPRAARALDFGGRGW
jgi:phage FluMu gp28-like protein